MFGAGRTGKWFPAVKLERDQDGKLHRQYAERRFSEDMDQQADGGGKGSVYPPFQQKSFYILSSYHRMDGVSSLPAGSLWEAGKGFLKL